MPAYVPFPVGGVHPVVGVGRDICYFARIGERFAFALALQIS